MTYNDLALAVNNAAVSSPNNTSLIEYLPTAIEYSESRCYRELDLLSTVTSDASLSFTAGTRSLALPTSPRFVVLQQVNAITPASTAPASGRRNPLLPASRTMLDMWWPSVTGTGLPKYFAHIDDQTIIVGPWPDAAYKAEFVGTIRPDPLSPTNTTTTLSLYLPDLFFAGVMISITGFQRNFGQQASDPEMAVSWESQFTKLMASAQVEEARKKFQSQAWSAEQPAPLATPPRS